MRRISLVALALLAVSSLLRAEQVVYLPGNGVTAPKPIKIVHASYAPEAFRRKIQGKVRVAVVVREDGTVDPDSVKVIRSVDPVYGLDDAVVNAVKQWRFNPGMKDGQPVAVRFRIDCAFVRS